MARPIRDEIMPGTPRIARQRQSSPGDASFRAPVAFGRSGTLYQGLNGWDTATRGASSGNVSVVLGRSDGLGDNWQTTLVRDARGTTGTDVGWNGPMHSVVVDTRTGSRTTSMSAGRW